MSNPIPKVRICYVVVSYYSSGLVASLLGSLGVNKDSQSTHVIVVDNSCCDREVQTINGLGEKFSGTLEVLSSGRNLGFAAGCNQALEALPTETTHVCLVNPDVEVDSAFHARLVDFFSVLPDVVVSPHGEVHPDTKFRGRFHTIWSAGGRFHFWRGRADVDDLNRKGGATEFATCACIALPVAALKTTKGLDCRYFLGGEEWVLSKRLTENAFTILYVPTIKYLHRISGTHEKFGLKYFYMGMRTKILYCRLEYGIRLLIWLPAFLLASPFLSLRYSKNHGVPVYKCLNAVILAAWRSLRRQPITENDLIFYT